MPEIIAPVLRDRIHLQTTVKIGQGVQAAVNAVVTGALDNPTLWTASGLQGVTYAAARAEIIALLSPSGHFPIQLVEQAELKLCHDVSKHMHGAEVDCIEVREGEHTLAEIIAVMGVFLFVRRITSFSLDVRYTDTTGARQVSLSQISP